MRGGWKGVRPGVRLKNRTVRAGRSPKNTSGTQRQCKISTDVVDNYRTMFESRISAEGAEKLPLPQNLRISSWSYDMGVERYCELANKTTQQLYKVSTPCIDDHHFKEEEMKSVGELSHVCSQIVLKCLS